MNYVDPNTGSEITIIPSENYRNYYDGRFRD